MSQDPEDMMYMQNVDDRVCHSLKDQLCFLSWQSISQDISDNIFRTESWQSSFFGLFCLVCRVKGLAPISSLLVLHYIVICLLSGRVILSLDFFAFSASKPTDVGTLKQERYKYHCEHVVKWAFAI